MISYLDVLEEQLKLIENRIDFLEGLDNLDEYKCIELGNLRENADKLKSKINERKEEE